MNLLKGDVCSPGRPPAPGRRPIGLRFSLPGSLPQAGPSRLSRTLVRPKGGSRTGRSLQGARRHSVVSAIIESGTWSANCDVVYLPEPVRTQRPVEPPPPVVQNEGAPFELARKARRSTCRPKRPGQAKRAAEGGGHQLQEIGSLPRTSSTGLRRQVRLRTTDPLQASR